MYAVGIVFLNLPRQIQYNKNMILCGLIPGPQGPSINIYSFLDPLIMELLIMWRRKKIQLSSGPLTIRVALVCIFCDSPAMRKVGGFLSHAANKGCYKCNCIVWGET